VNITDAAYAVAHDYPGGTESLAPRIPMPGAVLRNKVNANNTTHHLSLAEAFRMTDLTDDERILEAWARHRGKILIEMPEPENCADADVIELMAKTWETNGDIGREVNQTFADGRVEAHEVRRVKDRVWDHIRTLFGLVGRIEGMAEK
jgi:hypothetical protein